VLRRQLEHLHRHYSVVGADELPGAIATRRFGRRIPVAVTFDDDLESHVSRALPILRQTGTSATFFLGGSWGSDHEGYWWHWLERAWQLGHNPVRVLRADGLWVSPDAGPSELATLIQELPPEARRKVGRRLRELVPDEACPSLRSEGVRRLRAHGFHLGFHTREHHSLTSLSSAEVVGALQAGREEIEALTGERISLFAYPHGKYNACVRRRVSDAGYRLAFTTDRRALRRGDHPLALGRMTAPPRAGGGFALALGRTLYLGS